MIIDFIGIVIKYLQYNLVKEYPKFKLVKTYANLITGNGLLLLLRL